MKRILVFLTVALIILVSCSPSETAIQTAIAQTEAAKPTDTKAPVDTATPVPTATETQLPTSTPTITRTPTLELSVRRSMTAMVATDTATPTPKPTKSPYELTSTAHAETQEYLAKFKEVEGKDFLTYPDKYKSQFVRVSGKIFNINNNTEFQIFFANTTEPVYIIYVYEFDNLYKNDWVTVYGTGMGEHCGTNVFGSKSCQPVVLATYIDKR